MDARGPVPRSARRVGASTRPVQLAVATAVELPAPHRGHHPAAEWNEMRGRYPTRSYLRSLRHPCASGAFENGQGAWRGGDGRLRLCIVMPLMNQPLLKPQPTAAHTGASMD